MRTCGVISAQRRPLRAARAEADALPGRGRHSPERLEWNLHGRAPALICAHGSAALVGSATDRTHVGPHSQTSSFPDFFTLPPPEAVKRRRPGASKDQEDAGDEQHPIQVQS